MTEHDNTATEASSATPTEPYNEALVYQEGDTERPRSQIPGGKTTAHSASAGTDANQPEVSSLDIPPSSEEPIFQASTEKLFPTEGNLQGPHLGGYPPRRRSQTPTPSERLDAWKSFTAQHREILKKRIQADELRRDARRKRKDHLALLRSLPIAPIDDNSGQSDGGDQGPSRQSILSELEELETQVEQMEDELVRAEEAVSCTLPVILESEADKTFDLLEDNQLFFQVDSESLVSNMADRGPVWQEEVSPEVIRFQEKHDEVDALEEQLMEHRDGKRQLLKMDRQELRMEEMSFLETYTTSKEAIVKQLRTARSELEGLRAKLQPDVLPSEEAEHPTPSESRDHAQPPLLNAGEVYGWLNTIQEPPSQGTG